MIKACHNIIETHIRLEFTKLIKDLKEDTRSIKRLCCIPVETSQSLQRSSTIHRQTSFNTLTNIIINIIYISIINQT